MNVWYLLSLILVIIGIVFLIVCILASIFTLSKLGQVITASLDRINKQQVEPLQTQVNALTSTVNTLKTDIDGMIMAIQSLTSNVTAFVSNVTELLFTTSTKTKNVVSNVQQDPKQQAQILEWTEKALSMLNRKF